MSMGQANPRAFVEASGSPVFNMRLPMMIGQTRDVRGPLERFVDWHAHGHADPMTGKDASVGVWK